jgi:hypothetical protein
VVARPCEVSWELYFLSSCVCVAPLWLGGLRGKKSTPSWLGGTGEVFMVSKRGAGRSASAKERL